MRGEVVLAPGTRVSLLPQEVPEHLAGTVVDVVAAGLSPSGNLAAHFFRASGRREREDDPTLDGDHAIERVLSRMELPRDAAFEQLSSGMKRRVLLAQALVSSPDLLLLDEPTNHLDVEAIAWLERFLVGRGSTTLLFVTHDRVFLQEARGAHPRDRPGHAVRLVVRLRHVPRPQGGGPGGRGAARGAVRQEARRGGGLDPQGHQGAPHAQRGTGARARSCGGRAGSGARARGTASSASTQGGAAASSWPSSTASLRVRAAGRSCSDFSTTILRGDQVGIIGPNGAGKTTLLRLLLGELAPTGRHVRLGTNLEIAYFDQLREQLDPDATVQDNVAGGYDTVEIGGSARHILGYLRTSSSRRSARARRCASSPAASGTACSSRGSSPAGERPRARRAHERPRHRDARAPRGAALRSTAGRSSS